MWRGILLATVATALRFQISNSKWPTPEYAMTLEALEEMQTSSLTNFDDDISKWLQSIIKEPELKKGSRCGAFGCGADSTPLKRAYDIRTANGYYVPKVEYSNSVSQTEKDLLLYLTNAIAALSEGGKIQAAETFLPDCPAEQGWFSKYRFGNKDVFHVQYGCGQDSATRNPNSIMLSASLLDLIMTPELNEFIWNLVQDQESQIKCPTETLMEPPDDEGAVVISQVRWHACLDNREALKNLKKYRDTGRTAVRLDQPSFLHDCTQGESTKMGNWGIGLVLKNPEYRTINEAQTSADEEGKKTGLKRLDEPDDDQDVSEYSSSSPKVALQSLSEIVKEKTALNQLGIDTLSYISRQLKELKQTGKASQCRSTSRLACLKDIIEDFPSHLPPILANDDANAVKKLHKALTSLHARIDPRWNSLIVNNKFIGSQHSGIATSRMLSSNLIFESLDRIIIPLFEVHDRLEKVGLPASKLLSGFRLIYPEFDSASPIVRLLNKFNSSEPNISSFTGNKYRWDYRALPRGSGGYLIRKADEDQKGRILTSGQMINNLSQLLMGGAGTNPPYKFRVTLIHVIMDFNSREQIMALRHLLDNPPSSCDIRLLPLMTITNVDDSPGSLVAKTIMASGTDDKTTSRRRELLTRFLISLAEQLEKGDEYTVSLVTDLYKQHFGSADMPSATVSTSDALNSAGFEIGNFYVSVSGRVFVFPDLAGLDANFPRTLVDHIVREEKQNLLLMLLASFNPMAFGSSTPFLASHGRIDEALTSKRAVISFLDGVEEKSRLPGKDGIASSESLMVVPYTGFKNRETRQGINFLVQSRNLTESFGLAGRLLQPNIDDFYLASGSPVISARNNLCQVETVSDMSFSHSSESHLKMKRHDRVWMSPAILEASLPIVSQTAPLAHTAVLILDIIDPQKFPVKQLTDMIEQIKKILRRQGMAPGNPNSGPLADGLMPVELRLIVSRRGRLCNTVFDGKREFLNCMHLRDELPRGLFPNNGRASLWFDGFVVPLNEPVADHFIRESRALTFAAAGYLRDGIIKCALSEESNGKVAPLCLDGFLMSVEKPTWVAKTQFMIAHFDALFDDLSQSLSAEETRMLQGLFDRSSLRPLRLTAEKTETPVVPLVLKSIVDPLSKYGQYSLANLEYLHHWLNATVQVLLNPAESYQDLPLNRWSRNVMLPPLTATYDDAAVEILEDADFLADFSDVETDEILSVSLESPSQWFVSSQEAEIDLDNIKLSKTKNADVTYELNGLFVEGMVTAYQVEDPHARSPDMILSPDLAGGHTVVLSRTEVSRNEITTVKVGDTITMKKPGYFQFQVPRPGPYSLSMKEAATHIQIDDVRASPRRLMDYHFNVKPVEHNGGWVELAGGKSVSVSKLSPSLVDLTVMAHMTNQTVQELPPLKSNALTSNSGGLWTGLKSWLGDKKSVPGLQKEPLHIFSLASGHMYERLLRIMMLSAISHTDRQVNFWILDNFLSAKFKERVQRMEKAFEPRLKVHYVSYKWPNFLRAQVEKQRQIWAYKILFLDTLFPADLKRIIYVDADQIVRADLGELWDMDLEGRVYGFTPFCSDRAETAPFRFWDSGYWKEFLKGEYRYHISALFVVDLELFRKQQIGTELRQTYNQLSADPNSLANLDQDLPNFAQKDIPIFSLPQEWLWCETWCSDSIKSRAKTIDLCNNPLTHEPKLMQAQRIVPEWIGYDESLQQVIDDRFDSDIKTSTKDEL